MTSKIHKHEWEIIFDALGVAMVASLGPEHVIPCEWSNEAYENLQAKLVELGLVKDETD